MTPDLRQRAVDLPELMDDPAADLRMLERTYQRFELVNALVSRPGLLYRRHVRPRARRGEVRILDIGAGGGDLCRYMARRLRREGLSARITALDPDERAIDWARTHDGSAGVDYRCADSATLAAAGEQFDIIVSNHLLHHLDSAELAALLRDSETLVAPGGVVAHQDIARGRAAYALYAVGTAPFAKNFLAGSFIRTDGLRSIRRSHTATELDALAPDGWQVRSALPARLELRWEHPLG
ncbi:methyltransferase domain-containing protein [Microbacterium sp. NPDC090003]|uniref:methyltransferase domain-containing protein n=1 Tax=Microbacterium sp. NPDC090003 TaxID=3364203 RepID=UPI00380A5EE9